MEESPTKIVRLLPHQQKALESKQKYTALISGLGSGKTWTGAHWVIKMSYHYPRSKGFIGANTFSQLRNSTLSCLFNELMNLEIEFSYNQSSGILTLLGKEWLCKSMDNYDVHRGIEVGEVWLDECAYMKEEAFKVICGRLRDKRGSLRVLMTSTPKGFNWLYNYVHPDGEKTLSDCQLIRATSDQNKFLPNGYIDSLRGQYDEKLIQQELSGEFVNIASGRIYYAFNDKCIDSVKVDSMHRIYVGMDFNVGRMAAVIGQVINGRLYIIDEIFDKTPSANTDKVCKELIMRWGDDLVVIPDSTGSKLTSNANRSDHMIIQENGLEIMSASNPFRIDRYAAVNCALDKGLVIIDPNCKNLIKDLEQLGYKENTDKPCDANKDLSHLSDALGYLIYRTINPLKNNKNRFNQTKYA